MSGCRLRPCWFEPTFHKHSGKLCAGIQVHVEDAAYYDHEGFRPWRLFALAFKALRRLRPDYPIWRDFAYEYEKDRPAIDVINGSDLLRRWVDDPAATPADLESLTVPTRSAGAASARLYCSTNRSMTIRGSMTTSGFNGDSRAPLAGALSRAGEPARK